jgi:hypothetical protein
VADRALTRADLCWWDVWEGSEIARNGWTVERVFETTELREDREGGQQTLDVAA